jgi:branched-chain amino acid transport system permease protein
MVSFSFEDLLNRFNRGLWPYLLVLAHIAAGTQLVYTQPRSILAFLVLISSFLTIYFVRADLRFKFFAGALLAVVIIPLIGVRNIFYLEVIFQIAVFAALALGLNIVVGFAGLLDLGYVAFYAVGAYLWAFFGSQQFYAMHFAPGTQPSDLPFLLPGDAFYMFMLLGVIVAAFTGIILGLPVLRVRGDYLAIVTLGFGEIIRLVLNNWDSLTAGPNGLFGMKRPPVYYPVIEEGGLTLVTHHLTSLPGLFYFILLIMMLTAAGVNRLDKSRIGRAWVAIREDEVAAELSGVPTTRLKLLAYAMGAGFASVAGAFFAAKLSYVNPNFFLFMESCIVLCIVVLGGIGSISGIIIAGFILIAVPEVFRELAGFRMLAFGAIMTTMMIIRPEGLIPASRRKREFHHQRDEVERVPQ